MSEFSKLWDMILDCGICGEEALQIVTDINGCSVDVLNDVIYAATGYRNIEQYIESEL